MINCCDEHKDKGVEYDMCKTHKKINYNCKSLGTFAINTKHNFLAFVMFHDYWWHGRSLNDLLQNDLIFISFPISEAEYVQGNFVPYYKEILKPVQTCFNDIDWLFPLWKSDVYISDWDMRTPYKNLIPILKDWYDNKSKIAKRIDTKLLIYKKKLQDTSKELQVELIYLLM